MAVEVNYHTVIIFYKEAWMDSLIFFCILICWIFIKHFHTPVLLWITKTKCQEDLFFKKNIERLPCALILKRASKVLWKTGESTASLNVCARTAGDCRGTLRTNTMAVIQYGKQHSSLQLYQVPFPKIAQM